jgi:hypothetical protein
MQFDITGFLIFLAFILPGLVAQKSRDSVAPRTLKPLSPVAEVGEFVLAGVWVHALLIVSLRLFFVVFAKSYFEIFASTFRYSTFPNFLWNYRVFAFNYFVASLGLGYCLGFFYGWLIIKQPIRSWALSKSLPAQLFNKLGVPGFLAEQPVWYFVFKQTSSLTAIFLEVEMKDSKGFYTGNLASYGILDDSIKSKDFYLEKVSFRQERSAQYVALKCNGLLLNFEDVMSIQVIRVEPDAESLKIELS